MHRMWVWSGVLSMLLACTGWLNSTPSVGPMVRIITPAPGLPPEQVESLVLRPIEGGVRALEQVERVHSTAVYGVGTVEVRFEAGIDGAEARRAVSGVLVSVDLGDLHPVLEPMATQSRFVLLSPADAPAARLAWRQRTGVVRAVLIGAPKQRWVVELDPARVAANDALVPPTQHSLRHVDWTAEDLRRQIVARGVYLEDVATIRRQDKVEVPVRWRGDPMVILEIQSMSDVAPQPGDLGQVLKEAQRVRLEGPGVEEAARISAGVWVLEGTGRGSLWFIEGLPNREQLESQLPGVRVFWPGSHRIEAVFVGADGEMPTEELVESARASLLNAGATRVGGPLGEPELSMQVDRQRVAASGLSLQAIARTLELVHGVERQDVLYRWAGDPETSWQQVSIRNASGSRVPLSNLVTVEQRLEMPLDWVQGLPGVRLVIDGPVDLSAFDEQLGQLFLL